MAAIVGRYGRVWRRAGTLSGALCSLWLPAERLLAQGSPTPPPAAPQPLPRGSYVTEVVFTAILSTFTYDLGAGLLDTTARAWTFEWPADTSMVPWPAVESELRRLLRARAPVPADTRLRGLRVDSLRVTADSLVLSFTQWGRSRCPTGTEWSDGATGYRLALPWATRSSKDVPQPVLFSDGFCPPVASARSR